MPERAEHIPSHVSLTAGAYRDGGVFDYHLNHEYTSREGR